MKPLIILRKLAEQQRYIELKDIGHQLLSDTQDPAIYGLLALAEARVGDHAVAWDHIEKSISSKDVLGVDAKVDLGAALIALHEIDQAIEIMNDALGREPDHPMGLARMGLCYMQKGDTREAYRLLSLAAELEPESLPVVHMLVRACNSEGEYDEAQRQLVCARALLGANQGDLPDAIFHQYEHLFCEMQLKIWVGSEGYAQAESWLDEQYAAETEVESDGDSLAFWVTHYAHLLAEVEEHAMAIDVLQVYQERMPRNVPIVLILSELVQMQGDNLRAARLLHVALKHHGDHVSLWVRLSGACLFRMETQARKAAEKALELVDSRDVDDNHSAPDPELSADWVQAMNCMAQVESYEQKYESAEKRYHRVLARHDTYVPALMGLGHLCMQLGKIDEATALFERVRDVDPIKGHMSLINAHQYPEDESTLAQMERVADQPSLEGRVRSGILFKLASAWEKRKDYKKAFQCARLANESSRKFLSYDPSVHRDGCARIRKGFCKGLFEHRKCHGVYSTLPIFVVGMPRSGTTLVEQIIAGHSEIFGAGELGTIPRVIQGLNRWERHVGSGRSYPDCVDDLTQEVTRGIAEKVLDELQSYAPDVKHVVDKLPHNFENIGFIKFLFPSAKIISVRRDPRDIAMSNYFTDYQAKHGGMGFSYDLRHIGEQLADHNLLMHHWHEVFPGEILELHYEDVVEDLEGSAQRLLDYIGVAWEPEVLEFNKLERSVKTASVWQVRQPIYKTSKEKWKRYQSHLRPLLEGTNALVRPAPQEMLTLPEPGFLPNGVALFEQGDLDGAEECFKKMLHHNPEHTACLYMVGLVYLRKQHMHEGVAMIEKAVKKMPWHKPWRKTLARAYQMMENAGIDVEPGEAWPIKGVDTFLGQGIEGMETA